MTSEEAKRRFLATGEYDAAHRAWAGRHALEKIQAGDRALRAALIDAVRQRTKGLTFASLPPDFDAGRFVLGKVRPMVDGLFPKRERQAMFNLFEKALVFVTRDNMEQIVLETDRLSTARQIANLFLGSLELPALDDQPAGFVGFSEETTLYLSMAYFQDSDPFADWVVHEAAHVFHNWKRTYADLPETRTSEFLLNIAFAKRELFAYACEAYAKMLEQAKSATDRRRLYDEYVDKWMPECDRVTQEELAETLASAVEARNGWRRILAHCSPPRPKRIVLEHDPMETMKHDPELIRHILEHAAHRTEDTAAADIPVPDTHSRTAMTRHIALLFEHKLLEGHAGGPGRPHIVRALTSEGRDLLRALGDKGVREKIRHVATHLGEDVTIHIILDIAKAFLLAL